MCMVVPSDLLVRYRERRKKDLENCLHSLHEGNFKVIQTIGHQLKGNGLTFGFQELSIIGGDLERAALAHDLNKLPLALEHFSQWVSGHLN